MRNQWFIILFTALCINIYAQTGTAARDDSQAAQQYVQWIEQAINEQRWDDALTAAQRAMDFSGVSSDIPYLLAVVQSHFKNTIRQYIIAGNLQKAIETDRWVNYNEVQALLLKARMHISMRDYYNAMICLDRIDSSDSRAVSAGADAMMLRLLVLRGMASGKESGYDYVYAAAQFRSNILLAMDRFPRDPRPLRIFFEYAHNKNPRSSELPESDINLLELALRRLPFLLEADPELAWMAAPFIRNIDDARRSCASYRSGSLYTGENFKPAPASVPVALNLGLIDDKMAIDELFAVTDENETRAIKKEILINTYNLLRSEEGRDLFTRKLLSFTGSIIIDDDNDGYIENIVHYNNGFINSLVDYMSNNNDFHITVNFGLDNDPEKVSVFIVKNDPSPEQDSSKRVNLQWERYPFVKQAELANETFTFGPAVFNYAPVAFMELGGSDKLSGLLYPVLSDQYITLTYHSLLSFCSSYSRPSQEIDGAAETIYMDQGVILRVVETLNGRQVSVTDFEKGLPVTQHIDLDLDGRMETIRIFRRPPSDYEWKDLLDYRRLLSSSESDWSGDGLYKTMEVYLPDGSVVYSFDMDGGGEMNYSETGN
jgi:tetratricopeptide (TPR) repeat protein